MLFELEFINKWQNQIDNFIFFLCLLFADKRIALVGLTKINIRDNFLTNMWTLFICHIYLKIKMYRNIFVFIGKFYVLGMFQIYYLTFNHLL